MNVFALFKENLACFRVHSKAFHGEESHQHYQQKRQAPQEIDPGGLPAAVLQGLIVKIVDKIHGAKETGQENQKQP